MSRFIVQGGKPLSGEITASGNKNAILPMIAATLLTEEEVILENVPDLRDVTHMLDVLTHLGARVERVESRVSIQTADVKRDDIPFDLCEKTRTSFLFTAPLLHRVGRARLHPPGGDQIGRRRLDSHFYGLRGLGATVDDEKFDFSLKGRFQGSNLFFDEPSVTATEHILMAAVVPAWDRNTSWPRVSRSTLMSFRKP